MNILPDGCTDIVFNVVPSSGFKARIIRKMSKHAEIPINPTVRFYGTHFKPGDFRAIFGISADSVRDRSVSLSDLDGTWEHWADRLNECTGNDREQHWVRLFNDMLSHT